MKLKTYIAENNTTQEELASKLTGVKTGKKVTVRQTVSNAISDDCIVINGVIYAPRYLIDNDCIKTTKRERGKMKWKLCNDWKDLPIGSWLVKIDKDRNPYHVANVSNNKKDSSNLIIVGSAFHWDMGNILAYSSYDKFEQPTQLKESK